MNGLDISAYRPIFRSVVAHFVVNTTGQTTGPV